MKLIRVFIAFVVISLFVGIGSAFNGQSIQENLLEETNQQEVVETKKDTEDEKTDKEISKLEVKQEEISTSEEELTINNSFSESKKDTSSSKTADSSKEIPKNETPKSNNTNTQVNSNSSNSQIEQKQEIIKDTKSENNTQPAINDSDIMHSITKGRTEFSNESDCYAKGLYIQNKEMDSVLDWNEQHPDEMKQPLIDNSICYPIVKNGKEFWYLHFKTTMGNKDDELKELYK